MHESMGKSIAQYISNNIFYTSNNVTKLTEKGSYPINGLKSFIAIVITWSLFEAMVKVQ